MKIETEPSGIEFLREIGYIVTAEDFIPIVGTGKQFFFGVWRFLRASYSAQLNSEPDLRCERDF